MEKELLKRCNDVLRYEPTTGKLYWKKVTGRRAKVGDEAGCVSKAGMILLRLDNVLHKAHRICWLMHYGYLPNKKIDHINHISSDNRIVNLRDVSQPTNMKNMKLSKRNKSGRVGIWYSARLQKWTAQIAGKHLGCFVHLSDAVSVREKAEKSLGYHPNHGRNF